MYSRSKTKEGFKSGEAPADMLQLLTKQNSTLQDELNILKYRSKYEDLIIHMEDWAHLQMVKLLLDKKLGTVDLDTSVVEQFNSLREFKDNLNELIKFLDKTNLQ